MITNSTFSKALKSLLKLEGKYSSDPIDKGGETYCGISRNNFPKWQGWIIVDKYKYSNYFAEHLHADFKLQALVEDFYKTNFWNKMYCDKIISMQSELFVIAYELFELSVNTGLRRATIILQTALNILNRNENLYPDILTDGIFGRITFSTLTTSINLNDSKLIFNVINILQGSYYAELMVKNPVYEKYIGWFKRVTIIK